MLNKIKDMQFTQKAEWDQARVVLLSEPSLATFFGALSPEAVNFKSAFSLSQARKEHRNFKRKLQESGIEVLDLRELLKAINQPEKIAKLKELAASSINYIIEDEEKVEGIMSKLSVEDMVEIIYLRPEIELNSSSTALDSTTAYKAQYRVNPATNHYFMRDPLLSTPAGIVVANLHLEERQVETVIAELILDILDIKAVAKVESPGTVEGGDFIPAGDYVLQGQGLLSNKEGVRQLLEAKAYGDVEVAVVKDPAPSMEAMHLDTYFNFLGADLAVIQKERLYKEALVPEVDIYQPVTEAYQYERSLLFPDYLMEKGVKLIELSVEEQENFAPNFLLIEEKEIIGVAGAGEEYFKRLEEEGVKVHRLDFAELTCGYGGPHCMSQVISRQ